MLGQGVAVGARCGGSRAPARLHSRLNGGEDCLPHILLSCTPCCQAYTCPYVGTRMLEFGTSATLVLIQVWR